MSTSEIKASLEQLIKDVDSLEQESPSDYGTFKTGLISYLAIGESITDAERFDHFLNCAMSTVGATGAGLTIYDNELGKLVFRAAIGDGSDGIIGYEIPVDASVHGLAFATGEVQASTPIHSDIEDSAKSTFRNVLVAPLISGDETIGTISAVNKKLADNFSLSDIRAFEHFARLAAGLLHQHIKESLLRNAFNSNAVVDELDFSDLNINESEQNLFTAISALSRLQQNSPGRFADVVRFIENFEQS